MTENEKTQYKLELHGSTVEQLGGLLRSNVDTGRKQLIIDELSSKNSKSSLAELDRFEKVLSEKISENNGARDLESRMLRADVLVARGRALSGTEEGRVSSLGELLSSKDAFVVDAAALELLSIGSESARNTLARKEAGGRPMVKMCRLRIEISKLPEQEAIRRVLKVASENMESSQGEALLVAERSVLAPFLSKTGLAVVVAAVLKELDDGAVQEGMPLSKGASGYRRFLGEMLEVSERIKKERAGSPVESKDERLSMREGASQPTNETSSSYAAIAVAQTSASMRGGAGTKAKADPAPKAKERGPTFSRLEDQGEDLSGLDQKELFNRLSRSKGKIELRKAAKVVGDRNIAGTLKLSDEEKAAVTTVVQYCLEEMKSKDAKERVEACQQIERLWRVAAPVLVEHIDVRDLTATEAAIKALVLMRNEDVVRMLIEKTAAIQDVEAKSMAVFALGKMTEQRETLIPGRTCMNEKESEILAEKVIRPFLAQILKSDTNSVVREAATRAIEDLGKAADRRPIRQEGSN